MDIGSEDNWDPMPIDDAVGGNLGWGGCCDDDDPDEDDDDESILLVTFLLGSALWEN
jgi:hypothetical protein